MNTLPFFRLLPALSLLSASPALAALTSFQVVATGDLVNHYPGMDGQVGTGDDVVSGSPTATYGSAPNGTGSLSFNAFNFGGAADSSLPPDRNAVTFLAAGGTVEVDLAIAASGGGALIGGWDLSGTEPFPGHGAYSAQITAVNSGSYTPASGSFNQNLDFTTSLTGGTANAMNFSLSGQAWVVSSTQYGSGIGVTYVDDVLIPLAQSLSADSFFYAYGSGTVPASTGGTGGSFPEMDVTAGIFAVAYAPVPEPKTFAAAAGLLLAGFAVLRRLNR